MASKRVRRAVASSRAVASDNSSPNSSFHNCLNCRSASSVIVIARCFIRPFALLTVRGIDSQCRRPTIKVMAKPKAQNSLNKTEVRQLLEKNKNDVEGFLHDQTSTILEADRKSVV